MLSRWAQAVCVTYPESIAYLAYPQRAVVTGNPIRAEIARADRDAGRKAFKLRKKDVVLLVFGGSRGARHLNSAMINLYKRLSPVADIRVLHVAGPTEVEQVRADLKAAAGGSEPRWYRVLDYVENMGDAIAASDLVICRAGATTIAELTALGRPALLVPYPYATGDHQTLNATSMVDVGAAWRLTDADLDKPVFGDEIVRLLTDARRRKTMAEASHMIGRPMAVEELVEVAMETACRSGRNTDVCLQMAAEHAATQAKAAKAAKAAEAQAARAAKAEAAKAAEAEAAKAAEPESAGKAEQAPEVEPALPAAAEETEPAAETEPAPEIESAPEHEPPPGVESAPEAEIAPEPAAADESTAEADSSQAAVTEAVHGTPAGAEGADGSAS